MQKSLLYHEINYSRYISSLKRDIRNIDKQNINKDELNLFQKVIEKHQNKIVEIYDYIDGNQIDIDLLDVLINLPLKYESYKVLSQQLKHSFKTSLPGLSKIYDKIQDVTEKNYISADVLYSSYNTYDIRKYFNTLKQYGKLEKVYNEFKELYDTDKDGALNLDHILNEKLLEIQDICISFKVDERKDYTLYMQKLLKYLREFAKILFSEKNNEDLISKGKEVSVFEILNHKKPDITCNLLYRRNLDGAEFDELFCKLKLDLPYHITYISFPQITFDIRGNIESTVNSTLQKPRQDVINYVQRRSWFLAFLINNIHGLNDTKIERNEVRVKVFMNLMNLPDIQRLKKLFNNNETLTILHQDYSFFLKNYFDELLLTSESSALCDEGYIKLKLPKDTTWKCLYELVLTIPEKDKHEDIDNLRDILLCNLIKEKNEENYWSFVRYITNDDLRMRIIMEEMQHWPGEFCVDVLKSQISKYQHPSEIERLMLRFKQLEIYIKIKDRCNYLSWFEVDELCVNDPEKVMISILQTTDLDILMNYFYLHPPHEDLLLNITEQHLLNYFNKYSFYNIRQLLDILPKRHCINISIKLFSLLKNLINLNFIVNYLLGINEFDVSLKNIQISSRILQKFTPEEVEQSWSLIDQPLSILEMLLMNTRLEKFGEVYINIQHDIENTEFDESVMSVEKIDELLREYAEKSLDFKVVGRTPPSGSTESKLMLSIDSNCLEPKKFLVPDKVPEKSNWIPDNEIDECMCCRHTRFSMFNRRHHCRRCGRVICWSCSSKRMTVDTYGDVLVRVCNDCFEQTQKTEGTRIITEEYWILNGNLEHDSLVRQEFSFENAPSVMLCLSILKHHSKSEEYPKFLLQQCENILTILRPHKYKRSEEIDYNLIIKMLKALAIAAKVMSNQCMFQWGASLADKIMSQAEMLGLLAENRYLDLLPPPSQTQSSHLNTSVLRSVRDKLLELEQWSLGLEVSTKAGLDTTGIFAMWGKSFLQAGNLQLARQKFKMCFEKTTHFDLDRLSLSENQSLRSNRSYYRTLTDNKKILKDPLLLTEIVQILESKIDRINPKLYKQFPSTRSMYESTSSLASVSTILNDQKYQNEDAVCIMNDLLSLEAIEQGNYAPSNFTIDENCEFYKPHIENIFYEECVYYLNKYGSAISLCQFYVRHKDFSEALLFIHKNKLSKDIFIEIYIDCLKEGVIELLHNAIVKIDPSFDIWKEYIKSLCIYMEKQAMFNSLYQLQQFIGDFVRAALTCIKFYSSDVTSFSELNTRNEFLYKAQEHLKQVLEQEQWVDVTTVKTSFYGSFLEEKPITNAALVMKLDHKSVNLHINTIDKQVEVVKYLSKFENSEKTVFDVINDILMEENKSLTIPTLFGNGYEKILIAVLCIVISDNISEGFNITQSIIKDYKIKATKVYPEVGKLLAKRRKLDAIRDLVNCMYTENHMVNICDEMLVLTAKALAQYEGSDAEIETTIKLISNHNIKINTYIETRQLRSGFLLAAKHNKTCDVMRICREAEILNRQDVIKLCEKYLESHPQPSLK
nr:zinc finger FYVE domain-containing protein 26 homolog [Onthophagus taurus]